MKKLKIYVSGKITGLDLDIAKQSFIQACKEVEVMGYDPINAYEIPCSVENPEWSDYMSSDIPELLKSDGIYMMNNWGDSMGARIERSIALEMGLKIIYQGNIQ